MKISIDYLSLYFVDLPKSENLICNVLEDSGIEVKKVSKEKERNILTLELLANRGDHYGYIGIAREISAKLNISLIENDVDYNIKIGNSNLYINADPEICLGLSIYEINNILNNNELLPKVIDFNSINDEKHSNNIQDILNYILYDLGHPVFCIDKDKVKGHVKVLKLSSDQEVELSENNKTKVPANSLVMQDDLGIILILGVEVVNRVKADKGTKNIFLISGIFDPVYIRNLAKKMNIKNHGVSILERGGDIKLIDRSINRFINIFLENKSIIIDDILEIYTSKTKKINRGIDVNINDLSKYYNYNFDVRDIEIKLNKLGFVIKRKTIDILSVYVPSHRWWDIETKEDIYEEVGRVYGYDIFPSQNISFTPTKFKNEKKVNLIENLLVSHGFLQVITDSFYNRDQYSLLIEGEKLDHVELINSIDSNFSLMKNNSIINILDLVKYNSNYNVNSAKVFEITKNFFKKNNEFKEVNVIWGAIWGEENFGNWKKLNLELDFWYLKGVLEDIFSYSGKKLYFNKNCTTNYPTSNLHPNKSVEIKIGDTLVGFMGEIHPSLVNKWKLNIKGLYVFELNVDIINELKYEYSKIDIPEHMDIIRDISVNMPNKFNFDVIDLFIKDISDIPVIKIDLIDIYNEIGVNSYTFQLHFSNNNNLKSDDINNQIDIIKSKLLLSFKDQGLTLR